MPPTRPPRHSEGGLISGYTVKTPKTQPPPTPPRMSFTQPSHTTTNTNISGRSQSAEWQGSPQIEVFPVL